MQHPAWFMIILGLMITGMGLIWMVSASIPWFGNLPGDISIERENFRFYFPVATCMMISLALTVIAGLLRFFSR
jgi:hypothetical protein